MPSAFGRGALQCDQSHRHCLLLAEIVSPLIESDATLVLRPSDTAAIWAAQNRRHQRAGCQRLLLGRLAHFAEGAWRCCAQVSTILGAVIPSQRAERAWTEGVAIWVAVVVVSFVGAACALPRSARTRATGAALPARRRRRAPHADLQPRVSAVPLGLLAGVVASARLSQVTLVADAPKLSAVNLPCICTVRSLLQGLTLIQAFTSSHNNQATAGSHLRPENPLSGSVGPQWMEARAKLGAAADRPPNARARAASGNDYQKDQQFRKLNKEKDTIEVKAVRGGRECLVTNTDVVVGDVLVLDTGDKLVADGVAVEAFGLVIDEARAPPASRPPPAGAFAKQRRRRAASRSVSAPR